MAETLQGTACPLISAYVTRTSSLRLRQTPWPCMCLQFLKGCYIASAAIRRSLYVLDSCGTFMRLTATDAMVQQSKRGQARWPPTLPLLSGRKLLTSNSTTGAETCRPSKRAPSQTQPMTWATSISLCLPIFRHCELQLRENYMSFSPALHVYYVCYWLHIVRS